MSVRGIGRSEKKEKRDVVGLSNEISSKKFSLHAAVPLYYKRFNQAKV